MPATVTVLYPNVANATFDLDYYLQSHMPMVMERFAPHRMTGWRVSRITGTPSGEPPAYMVQAVLDFPDAGSFHAALAAAGEPVLADVPRFTDTSPIFLVGDAVGRS